jgi:hypothetical protein
VYRHLEAFFVMDACFVFVRFLPVVY